MSADRKVIIIETETLAVSVARDILTSAMAIGLTGIGWLVGISALQWIGAIFFMMWLITKLNNNPNIHRAGNINEARAILDEMENADA